MPSSSPSAAPLHLAFSNPKPCLISTKAAQIKMHASVNAHCSHSTLGPFPHSGSKHPISTEWSSTSFALAQSNQKHTIPFHPSKVPALPVPPLLPICPSSMSKGADQRPEQPGDKVIAESTVVCTQESQRARPEAPRLEKII